MASRGPESSWAARLLRAPVPWVYVAAYLVGVIVEQIAPTRVMARPAFGVAGAVLFVAGAAFAAWGWAIFRRADTTRVPGERSSRLVTWGPYRLSRNPMYVGLALAYLGEAGLLGQLWPVLCLPLVLAYVNGVVTPLEESRLRDAFGQDYERYQSAVRRWL
jgi:protein-S-isoprenylcysteine O-methyltransferase Ste14